MAGNLSELELLQIAKEVQETPERERTLTDYLTKAEKEAVKKIVQSLRASAQAMKLYIVKTQYIDALRIQEERKAQLAKTSIHAITALRTFKKSWVIPYTAALNKADDNLKRLNEQQKKFATVLNARIDEDTAAISRAILHGRGEPIANSFLLSNIKTSNALIEINRYMIGEGIASPHEEQDLLSARKIRQKALNTILKVGGEGLKKTVMGYIEAFDAHTSLLQQAFGQFSTDTCNAVSHRVREGWRRIDLELTPAVDASKTRLDEATEKAAELRQSTNILGKWYVLAAMGDVLVELGQNLA